MDAIVAIMDILKKPHWFLMIAIVAIMAILEKSKGILVITIAAMAILKKRNYMNPIDHNCCNYANSEYDIVDSWCLMRTIVAILAILKNV